MKRLLSPALFVALMATTSVPVMAQVHVDLPGVQIRIGHRAPPPVRHETKGHRPSPGQVWIAGAWDWQGNDWSWVAGRWERPERSGVRWYKARYVREGAAWRYEPGHWSNQRLVEGDDYRQWHSENSHNQGNHNKQQHDNR
jgi:hypothetical protein